MTKSTITRERAQQIFLGNGPEPSASEERELARMALAAMDSSESVELPLDYLQGHKDGLEWAARLAEANHPETGDWLYDDPIELAKAIRKGPDMPPAQPVADSEPVAVIDLANLDYLLSGADADVWPPEREEMGDVLLYRHAQPAPAVPDELLKEYLRLVDCMLSDYRNSNYGDAQRWIGHIVEASDAFEEKHGLSPWEMARKNCRAAMLQENPVCTCPSGDGSLRWPCPVHPGNSPVIPDGWTGNEKANAALMMLDRIETVDPVDDDRIDGIKRIVRELAAAPHDTPALNSVQSVVTIPGKWIPVSERMPEDEQEVLTINRMGHRFVSFFDKHSGLYFDRLDAPAACCIEHVLVTHWMPLPSAPKEGKP